MYRYSQQMRGNTGGQRMKQQMGKVLMILLVLAVVVMGIIGGNALRFGGKEQTLYREHMRSEASQAISQVNNLSRTGGSTTTNLLGKLRQHVYAIQTLQQIHVSLRGNSHQVVDVSLFDSIYSVIDIFDDKLQTGQQTKEPQTQLLTLLTELSTKIGSIQ